MRVICGHNFRVIRWHRTQTDSPEPTATQVILANQTPLDWPTIGSCSLRLRNNRPALIYSPDRKGSLNLYVLRLTQQVGPGGARALVSPGPTVINWKESSLQLPVVVVVVVFAFSSSNQTTQIGTRTSTGNSFAIQDPVSCPLIIKLIYLLL